MIRCALRSLTVVSKTFVCFKIHKSKLRRRIIDNFKMKDLNTENGHCGNGNWSTEPRTVSADYQVYFTDGRELRQRRLTDEPIRKSENVACERLKTNIIYFLIMMIVVLVGVLSYTLLIVFEEESDVLEPMIDEVSHAELPVEQRQWYDDALHELRESIKFEHNKKKAKNVILFVGDGMGLSTVTASRIYKYGEEGLLKWESFPHSGLLKVNFQSSCIPSRAITLLSNRFILFQ